MNRIALFLLVASSAFAVQRVQGDCTQGGKLVVTNGISSSPRVLQSFVNVTGTTPTSGCTVSVYITGSGGMLATLTTNTQNTTANPFTADATGHWFFEAANGAFDVTMSGAGIVTPFTLGRILLNDPSVFYYDTTRYGTVCNGTVDDAPAINLALNAAAGSGGVVLLPQGSTCKINSTITIPAAYVIFDCNGSTLDYTGTSDAVYVSPFGTIPAYVTGVMKNCTIDGLSDSSPNIIGIHQQSRIGFIYQDNRVQNFSTSGASCMEWENVAMGGASPGFSEQNTIRKTDLYNCSKAFRFINTSGLNSFFYNDITELHMTLFDGQFGWAVEASGANNVLVFGGHYSLKANINASSVGARVISITGGAHVERQDYFGLSGEQTSGGATSYSVYVDASSSLYSVGRVGVDNTSVFYGGAESTLVLTPPLNPTTQSVHYEAGQGISGPRHCKYDMGFPNPNPSNGGDAVFWISSFGGTENNCKFQLIKRNTDNMNPDVDITGTGTSPVNILYTDSNGNLGIGPNWSVSNRPVYGLDVLGSTFRTPNVWLCGDSKGCHYTHTAINSDEELRLVISATMTTATFNFTTPYNSLPNCSITGNTTMLSGLNSPNIIIGTPPVLTSAVDHISITEVPVAFSSPNWVASSFPFDVTYFVRCGANPN